MSLESFLKHSKLSLMNMSRVLTKVLDGLNTVPSFEDSQHSERSSTELVL